MSIKDVLYFLLDETHWFIGNPLLPNPDFPLIFDSVDGKQSDYGTSYSNEDEADRVMLWINKLIKTIWNEKKVDPSDIGVVT